MDRALTGAVPHLRRTAAGQVSDAVTDKRSVNNRKTAAVLLGVALLFFFGVMLKQWMLMHA